MPIAMLCTLTILQILPHQHILIMPISGAQAFHVAKVSGRVKKCFMPAARHFARRSHENIRTSLRL